MKIAVIFPGQGSQYLGMAREFVETDGRSGELMRLAEEVCEIPLSALINDGPMEELTKNGNLQPAITATNLICWQQLADQLDGIEIDFFAGHSLGEYSALCAAGVVSIEDTLRLVRRRGTLMELQGERNPGGMRAVLGLEIEDLEEIIVGYTGEGIVTVANHNTPQQIVISGNTAGLDGVNDPIQKLGGKIIPLNVSVANHSPLVADAVPPFSDFLNDTSFLTPKVPVYLNVTAQVCQDPLVMKEKMGQQIASRVRWCEIIQSMIGNGVDTFIEVGPKTVLKGMMRKITPKGVKILSLQCDTPKSLSAVLDKLR